MSKKDLMKVDTRGEHIYLKREQWKGRTAQISNYPGLLEEVQKYTWTYSGGKHSYLNSSKLKTSLHEFVLSFLYGKDKFKTMIEKGNIIEHLDNDGLNCAYDNLHILSADLNKMKAFSIDKYPESKSIPAFITDVYYSHSKQRYQMQIFFNRNIYFLIPNNRPIEEFFCLYEEFNSLFRDWFYLMDNRENNYFDISKLESFKIVIRPRIYIHITEEEKNHCFIKRNNECYMKLETENVNANGVAYMKHTAFEDIGD